MPNTQAFPTGGTIYSNNAITTGNLLSGLSVTGRYVLEIVFQTTTITPSGAPGADADPSASTYQADFDFTAPAVPTLRGTAVYITPYSSNGNANPRITYTVNSTATPMYQGANLGSTSTTSATYDLNTGLLILNGGAAVTTEAGSRTVNNVSMYYRVRPQGQGGGQFTAINLTQNGNVGNDGTRNFSVTNRTINLISSATTSGSYSVDIYYQAGGTNSADPTTPVAFSLTDDNGGAFYTASFNVTGNPIPSTVWTGGLNDNWFDDANWTNNVPTIGTNVVIANLGTNTPNPYPRILCNTTYVYTNQTTGASSTINNSGRNVAVARNLTMAGNSQADRSSLSLVIGTLNVLGDFDNRYASFIASAGTTIAFNGTNQSISGGSFANVFISGGGVKSSQGVMNVVGDIIFDDGLLVTDITQPTTSVVNLGDRAAINNNTGGRLLQERDGAYLQGFVTIAHRTATPGTEDLFGNIGLGLNFYTNPGEILVTRNTAQAYSPGNGAASGVRRIFEVTQSVANTSGAIKADMRFFYLDSETRNLGPSGNINIDENNLVVFASTNEGNTFNNLGGTPDAQNNIVTLIGTTNFAVPNTRFTLGDKTNPLPVELVAFDAKRLGANTSVTWQTASEKNSAGFEVEVATNGVQFKKLAFVASRSANSTTAATYSYIDTEAGKSGVRYYRLRQVDLDGQYSYSPIRAVSFAGTTDAAVASLSSYPSPFTSTSQAALVLQAPTAGTAQLQLMDLAGRVIANRTVTTVAGISEIAVPNASELAVGTYLVKVTFATGEVKTLRIQKH
ncbi:beta strand repeat-containing protein [Hymenobacter bucti]|uniref:Beta strand repeat-containing protein n=1 Tax=Hymenobacter bucti TaxID=1844114 RepID=A0ABW4QNZ9_9BACT